MTHNSALYLFAEIAGLILAVFAIDYAIKRSVERRRRRSTPLLHAQILAAVDRLLDNLLLPAPQPIDTGHPLSALSEYLRLEDSLQDWHWLSSRIEQHIQHYEKVYLKLIPETRKLIEQIAHRSAGFLDPELLTLLLNLEQALKDSVGALADMDRASPMYRLALSSSVRLIVKAAVSVRLWLGQQGEPRPADAEMTPQP